MNDTVAAPHRPKIAIACQGGGSQTAFTAGALRALLQADVARDFRIVSITGTSGGAICAALIWYGLRRGDPKPWERLDAFWHANTAQTPLEMAFNDTVVSTLRTISRGHLPVINTSPATPMMQMMAGFTAMFMRPEFFDLRLLLERHIDFAEIAGWGAGTDVPNLLVGAVDILAGQLRVFNSRHESFTPDHILASCAVPSLFPAVEVEGSAFWDGLFSDNPPVAEAMQSRFVGLENIPEEIWVIKINPTRSATVPIAPEQIGDRRNQLVGNMSLFQQLHAIDWLNDLYAMDAFRPEFLARAELKTAIRMPRGFDDDPLRPWHIPFIEMSEALQRELDYESKLDRNPRNLDRLMEDGETQALKFLEARRPGARSG
jgi:NTE family protein